MAGWPEGWRHQCNVASSQSVAWNRLFSSIKSNQLIYEGWGVGWGDPSYSGRITIDPRDIWRRGVDGKPWPIPQSMKLMNCGLGGG